MFSHSCGFFILFFLKLEDNCFTVLCWPLPCIPVTQPRRVYICPSLRLPHHPLPSRQSQSTGLGSLCSCDPEIPHCDHDVTSWALSCKPRGNQNFSPHSTSRGWHLKAITSYRTFPPCGAFTKDVWLDPQWKSHFTGKASGHRNSSKNLGLKIRPGQKDWLINCIIKFTWEWFLLNKVEILKNV